MTSRKLKSSDDIKKQRKHVDKLARPLRKRKKVPDDFEALTELETLMLRTAQLPGPSTYDLSGGGIGHGTGGARLGRPARPPFAARPLSTDGVPRLRPVCVRGRMCC